MPKTTRRRRKRVHEIEYERPDGSVRFGKLPIGIAWTCARAAAIENHGGIKLHGEYGTATFHCDGGGKVRWNEHTDQPWSETLFDSRTTVCI